MAQENRLRASCGHEITDPSGTLGICDTCEQAQELRLELETNIHRLYAMQDTTLDPNGLVLNYAQMEKHLEQVTPQFSRLQTEGRLSVEDARQIMDGQLQLLVTHMWDLESYGQEIKAALEERFRRREEINQNQLYGQRDWRREIANAPNTELAALWRYLNTKLNHRPQPEGTPLRQLQELFTNIHKFCVRRGYLRSCLENYLVEWNHHWEARWNGLDELAVYFDPIARRKSL
ncbi:hypothetical protein F4780DRAFT_627442 [Xylariomycetidae sp. FL0641]|nr:hypothetical protein F4780DRAFT_627442 [Xylariomycetidae sp. FL0641]